MYAMRSTSKSMLILLGFMYCSTCRVLLLKWSSSGPRSQPEEESLTITSWNRHKQGMCIKIRHHNYMMYYCCRERVTWCCNVLPPFCVTETLTSSSSSSRIFWLYSESFSRMYPVSSTMSSKWETWRENHRSRKIFWFSCCAHRLY